MKEMLSIYRDRLINLSSKNRTLLTKKLYRKLAFDLKLLEQSNGEQFSIRLLNLLKKRYEGKIKVLSTPYDENNDKLYNSFKYIKRESRNMQREKGSYDFYIGYPFVEGKFKDGTLVKAPLLLFPVTVKIENEEVFIEDISDEYISINKTFILAFKKYNEINLSEFNLEFEKLECDNILEWIIDYLCENGIYIDKEGKYDEIEYFKDFKKQDMDRYQLGDLVVKNNIVIGQFPNSTSAIYDDYVELINHNKYNRLIDNLIEKTNLQDNQNKDTKYKNKKTKGKNTLDNYFVTELDYSQEQAIKTSNKTNELVIYGPPGTGKSQVIVNLIVDNLAKGKKVLMVSQKKAAIDVVYNRLIKIGLENRITDIESPNSDRNKVFAKIKSTLEYSEDYFEFEYDMDFEHTSKAIDREKEKLEKLSIALNEESKFGLSLNQLYANSTNKYEYFIEELADKFDCFQDIKIDQLDEIIKNTTKVFCYLKYDIDHILIKNRKSFDVFQEIEKQRILDIVSRIERYTEEYRVKTVKNKELEKMERLIVSNNIDIWEVLEKFKKLLKLTESEKSFSKKTDNQDIRTLLNLSYVVKSNKKWTVEYWQSRFNLKRRFKGYKLNEILKHIDEMEYIKNTVEHLQEVFYKDTQLDINNKEDIKVKLKNNIEIIEVILKPLNEVKLLKKYFDDNIIKLLIQNIMKDGNWLTILSDISYMINSSFDDLKTLDRLKNKLTEKEIMILNYGTNKYDTNDVEKFSKSIKNTFYLKHIEILERNHRRNLNIGDNPEKINKRIENLLEEKRKLVPKVVINRLNNNLKDKENYSDIRYESEKKNNRMSLRRFVHSFYNKGLLDILPCWLVTPEAVSTIFPLKDGMFDLIIFDEASQMFIEQSIPAIYRAKSVVIAGDDKQLQPNDLYQAKVENIIDNSEQEEYQSKMTVEAKSLLELSKYKYQSITLNYHYRSIYEELINFSNYAFYGGLIEVVPNINDYKQTSPIERIKVDGRWIERKNIREAQQVVKLVKKILKTRTNNETIGIITFNITQKECIEELIERELSKDIEFAMLYRDELEREEGNEYKGIFIKNIENVQGDERDIIIFSVGYAKNEEGRVVRNFGSLTMRHGENRLNVAISRAKMKIYLITSIEPEELGYVDNLSKGAILLKKYLQYVKAVSEKDKDETIKILYSLDTIEKTNQEIIHFDSPFEEEVYERLVKVGLEVHTQVGSASYRIDMAIYDRDKSEYIMGIECDGATYHSSVSARERDAYRQRFLESRGWVIYRIWSRDWWKNRDREIEKVIARLKELR